MRIVTKLGCLACQSAQNGKFQAGQHISKSKVCKPQIWSSLLEYTMWQTKRLQGYGQGVVLAIPTNYSHSLEYYSYSWFRDLIILNFSKQEVVMWFLIMQMSCNLLLGYPHVGTSPSFTWLTCLHMWPSRHLAFLHIRPLIALLIIAIFLCSHVILSLHLFLLCCMLLSMEFS